MKEDSTIEFLAEVHGNPNPESKWYKDDQLVMDGEGLQISQQENFHKLLISGTEREDSGKYAIEAMNVAGRAKSEADLVVGNAPIVKKIVKADFYVSERELKVEVALTGEPAPSVKWLKDDRDQKMDDRVTSKFSEGVASLVIDACAVADEGTYKLIAENIFGNAMTEIPVQIFGTELGLEWNFCFF